jgi:hypothetical protein
MNKLGIDFGADLADAVADMPTVLTVGSRTYNVIADDERRNWSVEEPGRYKIFDRLVTLPLSAVHSIPAIQSTATIDNLRYYVADIATSRESDTLTLTLRREDGK